MLVIVRVKICDQDDFGCFIFLVCELYGALSA